MDRPTVNIMISVIKHNFPFFTIIIASLYRAVLHVKPEGFYSFKNMLFTKSLSLGEIVSMDGRGVEFVASKEYIIILCVLPKVCRTTTSCPHNIILCTTIPVPVLYVRPNGLTRYLACSSSGLRATRAFPEKICGEKVHVFVILHARLLRKCSDIGIISNGNNCYAKLVYCIYSI